MRPKAITFVLVATTLIFISCKKDQTPAGEGTGAWTVYRSGNIEYNLEAKNITRHEIDGFKVLTAVSTENVAEPKSINIWLKSWPMFSADYEPVEFLENRQLDDNQVGVTLTFPGKDTLYSTGLKYTGDAPDRADPIKVTIINGKLAIDIPQMSSWTFTQTYLDSASFKGVLTER